MSTYSNISRVSPVTDSRGVLPFFWWWYHLYDLWGMFETKVPYYHRSILWQHLAMPALPDISNCSVNVIYLVGALWLYMGQIISLALGKLEVWWFLSTEIWCPVTLKVLWYNYFLAEFLTCLLYLHTLVAFLWVYLRKCPIGVYKCTSALRDQFCCSCHPVHIPSPLMYLQQRSKWSVLYLLLNGCISVHITCLVVTRSMWFALSNPIFSACYKHLGSVTDSLVAYTAL